MLKDITAGHRAYGRYQAYAEAAQRQYGQTNATVWADIAWSCISLSLSESR